MSTPLPRGVPTCVLGVDGRGDYPVPVEPAAPLPLTAPGSQRPDVLVVDRRGALKVVVEVKLSAVFKSAGDDLLRLCSNDARLAH